ncbi:hypothetical protein J21TS7_30880 [Paenibacillus cineris]|uniref:Copper amine oxidase-like N-terminal domain-containing protein n=1 Tax=Paenibacillus cineris TaxID=237530 RepID=A0ABQ4LEK7_9BACL|nr:hypothetical protein J21TS7_30880 [Paenibacillus cineris]
MPLRTLRQSGAAANVTWNADKREVQVVVHPELLSTFSQLTFRIGSEDVYRPDGKPIGEKFRHRFYLREKLMYRFGRYPGLDWRSQP